MLLRAMFWIGLVALLMPHEPDLGLGRPGAQLAASDAIGALTSAARLPQHICDGGQSSCLEGGAAVQSLKGLAWQRLAQIKADIEEQQRLRMR